MVGRFSYTCMLVLLCWLSKGSSQSQFPHDWQGLYRGELQIFSEGKIAQKVPMHLEIKYLDDKSYSWHIQYGPDSTGLRPYVLLLTDPAKGRYEIDEKNGIILPADLLGNALISIFEVQDNLLISQYEKVGDELHFSICMSRKSQSTTTGGTSPDIPEVKGFPIGIFQTAILKAE